VVTQKHETLDLYVQLLLDALAEGLPVRTVFLDVACRLVRRIAARYSASTQLRLLGYIVPSWHVKVHVSSCRDIQAVLRMLLLAGKIDGEGSERIWADIVRATAVLRTSTHRHYVGAIERVIYTAQGARVEALPRILVDKLAIARADANAVAMRLGVVRQQLMVRGLLSDRAHEDNVFAAYINLCAGTDGGGAAADGGGGGAAEEAKLLADLDAHQLAAEMCLELLELRSGDSALKVLRANGGTAVVADLKRADKLQRAFAAHVAQSGLPVGTESWSLESHWAAVQAGPRTCRVQQDRRPVRDPCTEMGRTEGPPSR